VGDSHWCSGTWMIADETRTRRCAKDRPHQVLPESVFRNGSIHRHESTAWKNQRTELTDQKRSRRREPWLREDRNLRPLRVSVVQGAKSFGADFRKFREDPEEVTLGRHSCERREWCLVRRNVSRIRHDASHVAHAFANVRTSRRDYRFIAARSDRRSRCSSQNDVSGTGHMNQEHRP
jgi:hypothetical protein